MKLIVSLWKNRKFLKGTTRDVYQMAKVCFYCILGVALFFAIYSVFKDCIKSNYFKAILETVFLILISISTSLLASASFATIQELYKLHRDTEILRKKKFQSFFNCEVFNEQNLDKKLDKVSIVLPSYRFSDYNRSNITPEKSYKDKESEICQSIKNISEEKGFEYLASIKIFFDSAAISFSQSDAIAASNVVALFSGLGMQLPTIRTDLQALSKLFQHDSNGNFLDVECTFIQIQNYFGKETLSRIVDDNEMKKIIKDRAPDSHLRKYTTYITIGMFSNILLMDLLNEGRNDIKKDFKCVTSINENGRIVRYIKIRRDGHKDDFTPQLLLKESDIETDYALIARCLFRDKVIFVCAGVTVLATEAAAKFLHSNWEALHDSRCETFAIVIPVLKEQHRNAFKPDGKIEWWAYPYELKSKLFKE